MRGRTAGLEPAGSRSVGVELHARKMIGKIRRARVGMMPEEMVRTRCKQGRKKRQMKVPAKEAESADRERVAGREGKRSLDGPACLVDNAA